MNMKGLPSNFYSNVENNSINDWLMNQNAFYRNDLYNMLYTLHPEIENINENKNLEKTNQEYIIKDMKIIKNYYNELYSNENVYNYENEIKKQIEIFGKEILPLRKPENFKTFINFLFKYLPLSSFLFIIINLILFDCKFFNTIENFFQFNILQNIKFLYLYVFICLNFLYQIIKYKDED